MSIITDFYLGLAPDSAGRMINDIWSFSNEELELTHDYIQWLFPLNEKSIAVPNAPVLDPDEIELFRKDDDLAKRVLHSLDIMLQFYGFERDDYRIIKLGDDYEIRAPEWQDKRNHNYLRLTRIMRSLTLMNLNMYAIALHVCLLECVGKNPEHFNETTLQFWDEIFK